MLTFFFPSHLRVTDAVGGGIHAHYAELGATLTVNASVAGSLHGGGEGRGERDNTAVAFRSLCFMRLPCSYWGALELGRVSILVPGYYTSGSKIFPLSRGT